MQAIFRMILQVSSLSKIIALGLLTIEEQSLAKKISKNQEHASVMWGVACMRLRHGRLLCGCNSK